jgi:hypothetical protein
MVATQQEILTALLFEKEEQFELICNPPVVEGEAVEEGVEPPKPDLQFRDSFGKLLTRRCRYRTYSYSTWNDQFNYIIRNPRC